MSRKIIADLKERDLSRREYMAVAATLGATSFAGCSGGGGGGETTSSSGGGDTETDSTETTTGSSGGKNGGDSNKLNVGVAADVQNLDPALTTAASSFQVLENTQQRLFNITPKLEIVPQLATDLEISDDLLTWTIPLREGVKFHPPVSREMKADDFVYTFERIMDEQTGSPRSYYFELVDEVSAPDDYTLQLKLSKPTVSQKVYLASSGAGVIPKEAVEEFGGDLKQHPVGTGPFKFDEWTSGDHTTITKFEDYWEDDLPKFEEVTFNVIPKGKVRLTELQTGNIEYITSVPSEQIEQAKNDDKLTVGQTASPGFNYVGVNCGREPFDKKQVRQAIAEAIDRQAVVQAATFGTGQPTENAFPPSSPWHTDYAPYSMKADPEKAKQLLKDAGVSTPVEITITTDNKYEAHTKGAKVVQANLNQAGFDASIDLYDWGTFLDREHKEKYDVYVNGWTGFIDPDTYLYPIFHTDGGFNWLSYSNEEVDKLLEQGRTEQDTEKRKELYTKAEKMIIDDGPYIWMFHDKVTEAWRKNIKGHKVHPLSNVDLKSVYEE